MVADGDSGIELGHHGRMRADWFMAGETAAS
jgi:hypothetical protein